MELQLTKRKASDYDAKKRYEFLGGTIIISADIKTLLTQVRQCGERQNAKEGIQLTDLVCLAKTLQTHTPLPSLKLEHLNWN